MPQPSATVSRSAGEMNRRDFLKVSGAIASVPLLAGALDPEPKIHSGIEFREEYFNFGYEYGVAMRYGGKRHAVRINLATPGEVTQEEVVVAKGLLLDWANPVS